MKKVLIIVFGDLKHDARVMRQVNFLKKKYQVTVCCFDIKKTDEYRVVIIPRAKLTLSRKLFSGLFLLTKLFTPAYNILHPYKSLLSKTFKNEEFDLIIANDIETLPLAFHLKSKSTKILFDAHEYAPGHFEDKLWWRIFFQDFNIHWCRTLIPKVDAMTTIGQYLANAYEKNFGKNAVVITSACNYYDTKPTNADQKTIRLIHHGSVGRSRKIELIIQMIDHLPEHFTLDLLLFVPAGAIKQQQYFDELKQLALTRPRVTFRDAVTSDEINGILKDYDIGIILAPPINFNYSNGLPNKLYDYVQARLGVLTTPTSEIAETVTRHGIGLVGYDFTSEGMARRIADLDRAQVQAFKLKSDIAAKELNAEKNEVILNELVTSLLK